jgi:hypothetical protein
MPIVSLDRFHASAHDFDDMMVTKADHFRQRSSHGLLVVGDQDTHTLSTQKFSCQRRKIPIISGI